MSSSPVMTIQEAQKLLRKISSAKNGAELNKIVAANIMWCDGIFFAELDKLVTEFKRRGDESSASKLKGLGDHMARLRFMI